MGKNKPLKIQQAGWLSREEQRNWALGLAAVWLYLFLMGYPRPHVDDLFFAGAGISIAKGEGLKNPWLGPWLDQFGTDKFYVQTTFYAYILGFWLKIFGIGAKAILSLQCLVNFFSSVVLVNLLRKGGFTVGMSVAMVVYFILFVLSCGLRPEVFGILFILAGLSAWIRKTKPCWFFGAVLMACSPLFAPFLASIVIPLGVAWLFSGKEEEKRSHAILIKIQLSILAAAFSFFLLALSVSFEISEYFKTMALHASWRVPERSTKLQVLLSQIAVGYEPFTKLAALVFPYLAFLVPFLAHDAKNIRANCVKVMGTFLAVSVLSVLSYTQQFTKYIPFLSLVAGGAMVSFWQNKKAGKNFRTLWFVALILAVIPGIIFETHAQFRIKKPTPQAIAEVVMRIEQSNPTVFLDESAIRFFYDFRPPNKSLDWLLCRDPKTLKTFLKSKPNEVVWLVDAKKLALYVPDSGVFLEPLWIFGRAFRSFSSNQFDVHFIP